jgi:hypothetical protein
MRNLLLAGGDQTADGGRKVREDRVHQPRLADTDDRDAALWSVFTFIN